MFAQRLVFMLISSPPLMLYTIACHPLNELVSYREPPRGVLVLEMEDESVENERAASSVFLEDQRKFSQILSWSRSTCTSVPPTADLPGVSTV